MLVRNLWTIHNQNEQQTYAWVFETGDTVFIEAWEGRKYKISAGRATDVEITHDKVKLGFRTGTSAFDPWMGKPVEVPTNRDGVLTADGEAGYLKTQTFQTPDKGKVIDLIAPEQPNNIGRMIVTWGLGKIPAVGGVLSSAVGFVWKEIKPDIDDLITQSETRMRAWVRGQIDAFDRTKLRDKLAGLHKNLEAFSSFEEPETRREWLVPQLTLFNYVQGQYATKSYTQGTLAMIVDIATMHISLLREAVLFPDDLAIKHKDRSKYGDLLTGTIKEYQDFILDVALPAELKWRKDRMEISNKKGLNPTEVVIRDHVIRQMHRFAKNMSRNPASLDVGVNRDLYVDQALNGYENELKANVGDPARLWTLLDPKHGDARPIAMDRVTWVGPCSGIVHAYGNQHRAEAKTRLKATGEIRKIELRARGNSDPNRRELEFIKVHFADGTSKALGTGSGKTEVLEVPEGVYITEAEAWFDAELDGLRFHTSDGKTSKIYGTAKFPVPGLGPDRFKPPQPRYTNRASFQNHKLSGIRIDGNTHAAPLGHAIYFAFTPMPDFYDVTDEG